MELFNYNIPAFKYNNTYVKVYRTINFDYFIKNNKIVKSKE